MNSLIKIGAFILLMPFYVVGMENSTENEEAVNRLLETIKLWKNKKKDVENLHLKLHTAEQVIDNTGPTKIIVERSKNNSRDSFVKVNTHDGLYTQQVPYELFIQLLGLVDSNFEEFAKGYLLKKLCESQNSEEQQNSELKISFNHSQEDVNQETNNKSNKPDSPYCCHCKLN